MIVEKVNIKYSNEKLNDDNPIHDYDIVLDASNVDVGIDDHIIPPLDICDP